MKAFRLEAWGTEPRLVDVPNPEPGPGEVLVRIGGAGVCRSDLHLVEAGNPRTGMSPPFTLGHENAGWVKETGPGVHQVEEGQPVVVYPSWGCGQCRACLRGSENYCVHATTHPSCGLGRDGGMAEYMLVPHARYLAPLRNLPPWKAAVLADAGLTPYHAINRAHSALLPGTSVVVIGVGGLGHLAVQLLAVMSPSRIIAVDRSDSALRLASDQGAHVAVSTNSDPVKEIRKVTGGLGAEVVLDCVGTDTTLRLARKAVQPSGLLIVVGLGGGSLVYQPISFPRAVVLMSTYTGTLPELHDVIKLAESGRIHPHVLRCHLGEAREVYERLERGEFLGRAVVVP